MLSLPPQRKQYFNLVAECDYQANLQQLLGGRREVRCQAGIIDLLTDDYLIEVKHYKSWKHALGQLIAYDMYVKNRQLGLALYGSRPDSRIMLALEKINVFTLWHHNGIWQTGYKP